MNTGGDAADQMVREGIEIIETSVKLSALGAKNITAIAIALAKDNPKVRGKTNLDRLLKENKELKVFPLKADDIREFHRLAKQYGILYAAVKEKHGEGELLDIMAKAEDASKLNRVFEAMGYALPQKQVVQRKKAQTRAPSESALTMQRAGAVKTNQTPSSVKPSVRKAIVEIKGRVAQLSKQAQKVREQVPADKER